MLGDFQSMLSDLSFFFFKKNPKTVESFKSCFSLFVYIASGVSVKVWILID